MIGSNPFTATATRRRRGPAKIVGLIFLGLSVIPLGLAGLFLLIGGIGTAIGFWRRQAPSG